MEKKIISFFLTIILLLSLSLPAIAENKTVSFNPWSTNNKYAGEEETTTLATKLDKANLAYIITEAFDINVDFDENIEIKDVNKDYWAYGYICAVIRENIMPLKDGWFFPEEYITREELPQYFKFLDISYPRIGDLKFEDVNDTSTEYADLFKRFVTAGYLQPVSDNYLLPKRIVTITETIMMLNKMFPNVETKVPKRDTYDGHFLMRGENTYLSKITVTGDLIITEGIINKNKDYENNIVSLEDITVNGNIYISSSSLLGKFSFKNVKADNIIVKGDEPIIISFINCEFNELNLGKSLANIVTDKELNIVR